MPRRATSLAGTNLHVDPRTGLYVWRAMYPDGHRRKRSTSTSVLREAIAVAAGFEAELRSLRAGLPVPSSGWRRELAELVDEWVAAKAAEGRTGAQTIADNRRDALRALGDLGLRTCADLVDVARLDAATRALEGPGVTRATVRRVYQDTLKQLAAWLAGNHRVLDRDPLEDWEPIACDREPAGRPALLPDVVARAIVAAGWLDLVHGRRHGTRLAFIVLLVTAPRIDALLSRDVTDLERSPARIDFGKGSPRKRRGRGALDARTADELAAHVGDRTSGPLLLSPDGSRLRRERLLDAWQEAVSLGAVAELWPAGEPWDVNTGHLVNQVLLRDRAPSKGGNPKRVRSSTVDARREAEERARAIAELLRPRWLERVEGVDLHGLRTTHRTWAMSRGVPEVLIDLQLGHAIASTRDLDVLRVAGPSAIGRRHYTDATSTLLDVAQSAEAVRAMLDEALARVRGSAACGPQSGPHAAQATS
jgi:hypothetical protein